MDLFSFLTKFTVHFYCMTFDFVRSKIHCFYQGGGKMHVHAFESIKCYCPDGMVKESENNENASINNISNYTR